MVGAPRLMGGARSWIAVLALAIVPLLGATQVFAPPVVVVYPLTSMGGLAAATGGNIALLLATKLTQLGGVTVKPSIPGTDRPKFLDAAVALGADYYITGFLAPLGADSSLITQVVSTHSGSVVFSTTAVVRTYADAVAQADPIHDAILRHAGRGIAALEAPPPAPSNSPAADSAQGVNITRALRKRQKPTPAPTASPPPATAAALAAPPKSALAAAPVIARTPAFSALLFAVSGDADAADRAYATTALLGALNRNGVATGALAVPAEGNVTQAAAICAATAGTRALYGASLVRDHTQSRTPSVELDLTGYDCSGAPLGTQRVVADTGGRGGSHAAIDRAAAQAVGVLLRPSAGARH